MVAVVRRQDGNSPCGCRGAVALPSVAASYAPPAGRDKRGSTGVDVTCVASTAKANYRNDCRKRKIADVACRGSPCSQFVLRAVSLRM